MLTTRTPHISCAATTPPLHLVQAGGRENGLERVASPTNDGSDRSKTKLSLSTRCPPPFLTKTTRPQAIQYASLGIPLQLSTPSPDRMKQNLHIGAGAHVAIRGLFPGRFLVGGYKCEPWFVAQGLHMRLEPVAQVCLFIHNAATFSASTKGIVGTTNALFVRGRRHIWPGSVRQSPRPSV